MVHAALGLDRSLAQAPPAVTRGVDHVAGWLNRGVAVGDIKLTVGGLLAAVLVLTVFLFGSAIIKRLLQRYAQSHDNLTQSSVYTIERLVHYLLLAVGVLWALDMAGIPMAKMTVFAGALGVGLGFGLQAIFNNFVSGLILLFERSLKVGDFVELASGVHGNVRDIYIRATRISHQRQHRHPGAEFGIRERSGGQLDPARSGAAPEGSVRRRLRH